MLTNHWQTQANLRVRVESAWAFVSLPSSLETDSPCLSTHKILVSKPSSPGTVRRRLKPANTLHETLHHGELFRHFLTTDIGSTQASRMGSHSDQMFSTTSSSTHGQNHPFMLTVHMAAILVSYAYHHTIWRHFGFRGNVDLDSGSHSNFK